MERANTIRHLPHLATPKNTLQHRRRPAGCEWSALEPWRPNILGFERPFPPRRATGCPQAKPNCEAVMNLQVDDVVFDSSGEKCLLSEGVSYRVWHHPTPGVAPSQPWCGAVPHALLAPTASQELCRPKSTFWPAYDGKNVDSERHRLAAGRCRPQVNRHRHPPGAPR